MTLHDMAMTRFRQWWRQIDQDRPRLRGRISNVWPHPRPPFRPADAECPFLGDSRSPGSLGLAWPTRGLSLVLLAGYWLLYRRTYRYYAVQRGWPSADARLLRGWIVLAKFPQALGSIRYWLGRLSGQRSPVIEYRSSVPSGGSVAG